MKRRAFTLVELMVVIAILGLLVAVLVPSLTSVFSVARSTICQNNLSKLNDAFAMTAGHGVLHGTVTGGTGAGEAVRPYPDALLWPGVPKDSIADPIIFRCPEDDANSSTGKSDAASAPQDMFSLLEYKNRLGVFKMNTLGSDAFLYKARTGVDEFGPYTEFLLEDDNDNGQYAQLRWNGWMDTDGFVRVYHSGYVWVPATMTEFVGTPEWAGASGAFPNSINSCGDYNIILFRGTPAFGADGQVRLSRGQRGRPGFKIPGWSPWLTNYGISSAIKSYPYGTRAIVLADYKELIVELNDPLGAESLLYKSVRHMGKLNCLWADGSVVPQMPLAVSPRYNMSVWQPPYTPTPQQ